MFGSPTTTDMSAGPRPAPELAGPVVSRLEVRARWAALALAAIIVATGLAVLGAWQTGNKSILLLREGWTPMTPITATTFTLSGLALLSLTIANFEGRRATGWRLLATVLGALVALIGLRRLFYYFMGWTSTIDMFGLVPPAGPGRMAFLASISFSLAGISLVLNARRRAFSAAQLFAAGVVAIGWMSLTRYLYGGDVKGAFFLMAFHTSLMFVLLGTGLVLSRPDRGFVALWGANTAGGLMVRRVFPTAMLMPVFVGWLRLQGERAGWYGLETGLAIFATSNVVVFVTLAWHTARSLHRQDLARMEVDKTLREEKRFSDGLLDSLPGIFYFYDKNGRFLRWNQNFERVSGYSGAEISTMHPSQFIAPEDRARLAERIEEVFARGESELEAGFLTKQGSVIPYFFTGMTIVKDGEVCLAGVGIDITARRTAETALLELNADLERRVARRTEQLDAKNRELETFTYSVSHDLKAPLRGIDGYSRLLQEDYHDKMDAEGRRFLASVRQACGQMAQLIDDLLAYSRLERRELQTVFVPLREVVEAELAVHAEECERRGVTVHVNVPAITVWADLAGLTQAVRNLIDNAFKFTRAAAQPRIEIVARLDEGRCVLSIADNGVGFDMKFGERIFEIFQRLHRAEDYPGTGVGLAIVRKAMERMDGRAWTCSEPGKGATFFLEIPLPTPISK